MGRLVKCLLFPQRYMHTGTSQKPYLIKTHTYTYGSCTHPLHQGSLGRRHSAVWRGGRCRLNIGNIQQDIDPEEEEYQAPRRDKTLHRTRRHSPALRHTSNSLGYTERSTYTGTGPRHRSEAGELLVLTQGRYTHIITHACRE